MNKHLQTISLALCLCTAPTFAQSDLPNQTLVQGMYSGGLASAESVEFTETTVIESVIVPFFTRYYVGDQDGTLNVYIGHGTTGPLYTSSSITAKGTNKFFPMEDLIGLNVSELEPYWSEIWMGAQDGTISFDDMVTEFPLGQFGETFAPGIYTFELVLDSSAIYANDGAIWATTAGNCFSDFVCPETFAPNPYVQGNFYWGNGETPENIYADADMAFAFKRGLSTSVENPANERELTVTLQNHGELVFPADWLGEQYFVRDEAGRLLEQGRVANTVMSLQSVPSGVVIVSVSGKLRGKKLVGG